jgi:hypothetical protein
MTPAPTTRTRMPTPSQVRVMPDTLSGLTGRVMSSGETWIAGLPANDLALERQAIRDTAVAQPGVYRIRRRGDHHGRPSQRTYRAGRTNECQYLETSGQ